MRYFINLCRTHVITHEQIVLMKLDTECYFKKDTRELMSKQMDFISNFTSVEIP